jgi:hypothetical protein
MLSQRGKIFNTERAISGRRTKKGLSNKKGSPYIFIDISPKYDKIPV